MRKWIAASAALLCLSLCLSAVVGLWTPLAPANNSAAQQKAPQWEYRCVALDELFPPAGGVDTKEGRIKHAKEATANYSALGAEGWELVGHVPHVSHAVFKRPKR